MPKKHRKKKKTSKPTPQPKPKRNENTPSAVPYVFGRPTKYEPRFCQMLIEHMASGLSFESFAAVVKVTFATLYNWEKDYPDFFDAKNRAYAESMLYWERIGREGVSDITEYNEDGKPIFKKSINAAMWIFNMKNRFKHAWKDKHEVEVAKTSENLLEGKTEQEIIKLGKEAVERLGANAKTIDVEAKPVDEKDDILDI